MMLGDWQSWSRSGWYREVKVKSEDSQRIGGVLVARSRFVGIRRDIENQVRRLVKKYGLLLSRAIGRQFEASYVSSSILWFVSLRRSKIGTMPSARTQFTACSDWSGNFGELPDHFGVTEIEN